MEKVTIVPPAGVAGFNVGGVMANGIVSVHRGRCALWRGGGSVLGHNRRYNRSSSSTWNAFSQLCEYFA